MAHGRPGREGQRRGCGSDQTDPNAIGYVDFAQAQRAGLTHALVRNHAGKFVTPGVESFRAAADSAGWGTTAGFDALLTDAAGEGAYPIVATTFVIMPRRPSSPSRSRAALEFFCWSLDNGARAAGELGYVALPPGAVAHVKRYWASNF